MLPGVDRLDSVKEGPRNVPWGIEFDSMATDGCQSMHLQLLAISCLVRTSVDQGWLVCAHDYLLQRISAGWCLHCLLQQDTMQSLLEHRCAQCRLCLV